MKNGKYVNMEETSSLDNLPSVEADIMTKGSRRLYELPLGWFSAYPIGKYRIRICAFFSIYNKGMKDVFSNWANFEIKQPLKAD
jgi:hypothetical protein